MGASYVIFSGLLPPRGQCSERHVASDPGGQMQPGGVKVGVGGSM